MNTPSSGNPSEKQDIQQVGDPEDSNISPFRISVSGTSSAEQCAMVGDRDEMTLVIRGHIDSEGKFAGTAELTPAYRRDTLSFHRLQSFREQVEKLQEHVPPDRRFFPNFDP